MSNLEAITLFDETTKRSSYPKIEVHAIAVFSILNNFMRRSPRDSRVMGTLLGERKEDGTVVVTECFAVPFQEKVNEVYVAIDLKYHKHMYSFHRRNNKNEVIVGWYTTSTAQGQFITDNTSLMYDFYSKECDNPVHISVDTSLLSDNLSTRGFVSDPLIVGGEAIANKFQEVQVDIVMNEAESTCLYHMIHNQEGEPWSDSAVVSSLPSSAISVEKSIIGLQKALDSIQAYVDDVVDGKIPPSRDIGVAIADSLNTFSAPKNQSSIQQSLQTKVQDLLMVSYLTTLTQTQTVISEKLNEIL